MALTQPDLIPTPWAGNGQYADIPATTSEAGRASWAVGFPPETALPVNAGGIPPHWLDFQGVLHVLSQAAVFAQSGARYAWASTLDYPVGACILGSNSKVYQASQASGPGTAAGAKNPTTSAGASYWTEIAVADGTTITVNNGKLTANPASIGPALADGTTITANGTTGKLSVRPAGIADGSTITVNGSSKLAVDAAGIADGVTITVNAQGKLVGAPGQSASSLADGTTIVASNDKLSVAPAAIADGTTIKVASGKLVAQCPATINGVNTRTTGAVTLTTWGTARNFYIADNSAAHAGPAVSVNGSANATLKLPATIAAALDGNAQTASRLQTARSLKVALGSTATATFDGSANQNSIPVSGVLDVAHGGTGATDNAGLRNSGFVMTAGDQNIYGAKTFKASITMDAGGICKANKTGVLYVNGGDSVSGSNGAHLTLWGGSHSTNAGVFNLTASTTSATLRILQGTPAGNLTWNGNVIQTTSDERLKTPMSEVPDEILDAWETVQWGQFRFLDAVEDKGQSARLHAGLIAQKVDAAFKKLGLDACRYGILCYEKEQDLWMVRYEEALCMEAACQRRRADRAEARLAALEERLTAIEAKLG